MNENRVRNWYNAFSQKQVATGVNLRHYKIMNYLIDAGLKRRHTVLEVGCGIGALTSLLAKYVDAGNIVATDISDESIDIARERTRKMTNIEFIVTDMNNFEHENRFDFVVMADVLEHIPIEEHARLFHSLSGCMHNNARLFIHIPHPVALDYIREKTPEKLQIIDQSLHADELIKHAYGSGLRLVTYMSYCLFARFNDYVMMTFTNNLHYDSLPPKKRFTIILNKLIARTRYLLKR